MIIGIGCDVVNITRIARLYDKYKEKFLIKILTPNEIALFYSIDIKERRDAYLAKRFAAKEAYAKAWGEGLGSKLAFTDIEVKSNKKGRPYIVATQIKLVKENSWPKGQPKIHLSLSDDHPIALAYVIISLD